jgi:hypothetical protein
MKQLQELRVFGGHYWVGDQILHLEEDKKSMLRMPEQHLKINPKDSEGR